MTPTLFIGRNGAIVEARADGPSDRLENLRLTPGVMPALAALRDAGYRLVMIEHRGGSDAPAPAERATQEFILALFASQAIHLHCVLIGPDAAAGDGGGQQLPTRFIDEYLAGNPLDPQRSAVIGSRNGEHELARHLRLPRFGIVSGDETALGWPAIVAALAVRQRIARVERATRETRVRVRVNLDAVSPVAIATGIGFFDHMLEQIARHGGFALELDCQGDLEVDEHHTVEDSALALGQALREALGDKLGIARYGFLLAMDEAEAQVALDLSGRAFFAWRGSFARDTIGALPTELVPHFFRSFADALGGALHLSVTGENTHHMVESCFKGVGRALRQAVRIDGRELPTTKGVL
jgi:imidazoleglycerol-phosphate dehydratase/histidinol-phosphatase